MSNFLPDRERRQEIISNETCISKDKIVSDREEYQGLFPQTLRVVLGLVLVAQAAHDLTSNGVHNLSCYGF